MNKAEFLNLIDGLLELYNRKLSSQAAILWWLALEGASLAEIQVAIRRYIQDPKEGRFPPTPAAIKARLPRARQPMAPSSLSPDEAWAHALCALDERKTVCTTDEVLEALASVRPVWETGDVTGARMAFRAAYTRVVEERQQQGIAPRWVLSLGWDPEHRAQVAEDAVRRGLLPRAEVQEYLPDDSTPSPARLSYSPSTADQDPEAARAHLQSLREILRKLPPAGNPGLAEQRALLDRRVQEMVSLAGEPPPPLPARTGQAQTEEAHA